MHIQQIFKKKPIVCRFLCKSLGLVIYGLFISTSVQAEQIATQPITDRLEVERTEVEGMEVEIPLTAQLTLKQAITKTLAKHPQLASFVYQQQTAQGMIEQMGTATPKSISIGVEDVLGNGSFRAFKSMQTSLNIAWLLESEAIDARVNLASSKARTVSFAKEAKALDVAAQTSRIFIILLSQTEQLKLAKIASQQAEDALSEVTKRVNAGQANSVDQFRAKAVLSQKALVVEDLLHEIEASKAQLAAQWQGLDFTAKQVNEHSEFSFDATGNLLDIPSVKDIDIALAQLRANPRLKLFAAEQRIAQSEIALAQATNAPAWKVSTGIKRNETVDDFSLTAGIIIPFGSENRNRGKIRAMQAKQLVQQTDADAWYQSMATEVLLLGHKLKHNRHVIEGLMQEIIPALEQANQQARKSYGIGQYSYSDWSLVQQELLAAKTELINAYTNVHLSTVELERLTGTSMVVDNTSKVIKH